MLGSSPAPHVPCRMYQLTERSRAAGRRVPPATCPAGGAGCPPKGRRFPPVPASRGTGPRSPPRSPPVQRAHGPRVADHRLQENVVSVDAERRPPPARAQRVSGRLLGHVDDGGVALTVALRPPSGTPLPSRRGGAQTSEPTAAVHSGPTPPRSAIARGRREQRGARPASRGRDRRGWRPTRRSHWSARRRSARRAACARPTGARSSSRTASTRWRAPIRAIAAGGRAPRGTAGRHRGPARGHRLGSRRLSRWPAVIWKRLRGEKCQSNRRHPQRSSLGLTPLAAPPYRHAQSGSA